MAFPDLEEGFNSTERSLDATPDLEEKAFDPKREEAGQANDWEEEAFFSRSKNRTEEEGEEEPEEEFFGFYPDSEEEGEDASDKDEDPLFHFGVPAPAADPVLIAAPGADAQGGAEEEFFGFPEEDLPGGSICSKS